ncbi:MAG: autotransporter outer membrane beta-barrel domain-containing protein [Alphaproteobacteria bacterium]|nr:autotransporter outer membrane beta-barrel domain-containing protein [Alphaproteobacteria bacterium]
MKKIFFTTFCVFLFHPTLADILTLAAYDPTYYAIIDDLNTTVGRAGILTGVSDIYYYYEPFSGNLTLTQTEWLSDGLGDEVPADYNSTFHYTGVTFNNMHDILSGLIRDVDIENLRNQFIEYQLTYSQPQIKIIHSLRYILLQQDTNIMNLTINRLHNHNGKNKNAFRIWAQTLYNHSKYTGETGFSSGAFGVAFGFDNKITNSFVYGIGYNYNSTSIQNVSAGNNILFAYGQYHLNYLFIDATVGYNTGDYDMDNNIKGKTNSYFGDFTLTYENDYNIMPSVGLRYIHNAISPDNKNINKYDTNLMMFVSGLAYDYQSSNDGLHLKASFSLTYDIAKSDKDIIINIPEVNYTFGLNETISPLGLEAGFLVNLPIGRTNLSIEYDIGARSNYISHTGALRLAYKF